MLRRITCGSDWNDTTDGNTAMDKEVQKAAIKEHCQALGASCPIVKSGEFTLDQGIGRVYEARHTEEGLRTIENSMAILLYSSIVDPQKDMKGNYDKIPFPCTVCLKIKEMLADIQR